MNSLDEIIFSNRNKDYGAFNMRRRYPFVIFFSSAVTMVIFVAVMLVINAGIGSAGLHPGDISVVYNISDTSLNKYPEQKNPSPPAGGQIYIPVFVPEVVDTVPPVDTLRNPADNNGNDTAGSGTGSGNGDGSGSVFYNVEEPPVFPGGEVERMKFIQRNIIIPPDARLKKIHGKVFVSLIIEKNGSVSNVVLVRGIGHGCDEEAVRVVRSMPSWKPGKQNGQPVRVYFICPIVF